MRRLPTARPGAATARATLQTQPPVLRPDTPHAQLAEASLSASQSRL